ncbi:MAG: TauD/TfdA family dioxygenase [Myxococcales bacterium]|nr:TauD/TfdA family dioxygenase [Myxococcales bacterium]
MRVDPLTANIGAEVSGLDLREELSQEQVEQLEAALLEHLVLFFRDQAITPEQQIAFSARFGELLVHPFGPIHPDYPEIIVLDQVRPVGEGTDIWHADTTYLEEPPLGSVLRAVELPPVGGDTYFGNMFAAYEALSPEIQEMIGGLRAVHDIAVPLVRAEAYGDSKLSLAEARAQWPPTTHPVVRTHPVSGRKALYVNRNATTHIEGLSERENEWLLPLLCDQVRSPAFQCRFQWEKDSIAFWDNRGSQHYAVPDYDVRRMMHRTTLLGDRPY